MILSLTIFLVSLAALVAASDWFVAHAEKIGLSWGISPFVIGVTIVAFGTSLPELASSIAGIYSDTSYVVVTGVVGSNITNILLVLGLTAVIGREILLDFDVMDIDMPLLFGSAFLLYFTVQDANISTIECLIFLAALVFFLANSIQSISNAPQNRVKASWKSYAILICSGVVIYFGAVYTIWGLKDLALRAQIPGELISTTVLALGTSLPEVVVSIAAARRGKHGIAVGNILGSNIFNTYAVMAIPGLLGDLIIPDVILSFGVPFMVAVTVLFGMICLSKKVSRWEGLILLLFYAFFILEFVKRGGTQLMG